MKDGPVLPVLCEMPPTIVEEGEKSMSDLKSLTPDETLDTLGRVCPYPLLLTKKKMEKLESGKLLKVICDAPASAEDTIPRFAEKEGYVFESVKVEDKGYWELLLQKK